MEASRKSLMEAPMLAYPDPNGKFILETNCREFGLGNVVSPIHDGQERVASYHSCTLSKSERNYFVTRVISCCRSVKQFLHYLYGVYFMVRTDHGSLEWLINFKNLEGQLATWNESHGTYNVTLEHRPWKQHGNAVGMSRHPCTNCK